MGRARVRIGITAPGGRITPETAERARATAAGLYPDGRVELVFHPQCFAAHGHFAGDDDLRAAALIETANDPALDAVWFARGGYGACRVAETVVAGLDEAARSKMWLGYSDAGSMLAVLYRAGFAGLAHGPMVQDLCREGGEAAFARALAWLVDRDRSALEPGLRPGQKAATFNITILSQLLGTPLQPELSDHVLILEEVSEHMYRIDRALFHITSNPDIRRVAGIRLGRCSLIPPNEPDFGQDEEAVARYWCERSGIPWLGRADVGHDVDNRVAPFGTVTLDAT